MSISKYAKVYDRNNINWRGDKGFNLMYLRYAEEYFNNMK